MKTTIRALGAIVLAAVIGCHHEKPKTTPLPPQPDKPVATANPKQMDQMPKDQKMSQTLAISGDLVQLCGLKATASAANPKFEYDKDELTTDDRNVLDQLATCMTTGPLKGKAVSLIGRADPRGTEEYNLGLGSRRAASVSKYLEHLGVANQQLAVTTRGALDATGTDEAGWANDRRVDITPKQD